MSAPEAPELCAACTNGWAELPRSSHSPSQKQRDQLAEHPHPSTVPPGLREAPVLSLPPGEVAPSMLGGPGTHLGTNALLLGEAAASGSDAGRACRAGAQGGWQVPAGLRGTQGTVWVHLGHAWGPAQAWGGSPHVAALHTPSWPLQRARPVLPLGSTMQSPGHSVRTGQTAQRRNLGHRGGGGPALLGAPGARWPGGSLRGSHLQPAEGGAGDPVRGASAPFLYTSARLRLPSRLPAQRPPPSTHGLNVPGAGGALGPEPCAGTSASLMSWGQGCSKPGIQPEHGPDGSERALLSRQPPREVAEPTGHSAVGSGEDLWIKDSM